MMRLRTLWFILLVVVILGAGWGIVHVLKNPSRSSVSMVRRSPQEIHVAWVTGVQAVLHDYDQTSNAIQARDALLKLFVNTEDQPVHLALVLAFQAGTEHRADAAQKIQTARRDFLQRIGQP